MSLAPVDLAFWSRVKRATKPSLFAVDYCWLWTGNKRLVFRNHQVHHLSYKIFRGDIPADAEIVNTCRNPLCVHPLHLNLILRPRSGPRTWPLTRTECQQIRRLRGLSSNKAIATHYRVSLATIEQVMRGSRPPSAHEREVLRTRLHRLSNIDDFPDPFKEDR